MFRRTIRTVSFVSLAIVFSAAAAEITTAQARQPLTNDDVVMLVKAGLAAAIVVAKIESSDCRFDTSTDALVKLRAADVPDAVLLAMVQAVSKAHGEANPPSPSVPGSTIIAPDTDGKTRVFVTDSQSWSTFGYSWLQGSADVSGGSVSKGGARPQTVEIIKTLGERCPELTVTNQPQRANYVLTLDHEGGKGLLRVRNKVAVFNRAGDSIFSDSTRTLGEAVQRACGAIKKDSDS